jgi:uracil-DNA glycosylase
VQIPAVPRGHRDRELIAQKHMLLDEPHIRPVSELVRKIRRVVGCDVPYVDPTLGGIRARVLLLLEAPAAAAAHRSGMLSPDNDDGTAANVFQLYESSGLTRRWCLHWNVVPWYIGSGSRIRTASRADVLEGQVWLARLIQQLPDLRLVVAMGSSARNGFARYLLREDAHILPWLAVPHPSQRIFNVIPDARPQLEQAFRIATQHVQQTA